MLLAVFSCNIHSWLPGLAIEYIINSIEASNTTPSLGLIHMLDAGNITNI